MHGQSEVTSEVKQSGRLSQLRRWAAGKLRLTPNAEDHTTRRAVSAPSSPKLIRSVRLRSTSAENMASNNRNDPNIMSGQSAPEQSQVQSPVVGPQVVVNTEFDCSTARTRSGTNYLSRQPLKVLHSKSPARTEPVGEDQDLEHVNFSGQAKENILLQVERQMSNRSSIRMRNQSSYIHPINGNFSPTNIVSQAGNITNQTGQASSQTPIRSQEEEKKEQLRSLSSELNQLVAEIADMDLHMMDNTDWWRRYPEYLKPYQDRMQNLIQRLIKVDVLDNEILKAACKEDESLAALKRSYESRATDVMNKYGVKSTSQREQRVEFQEPADDDREEILEIDPVVQEVRIGDQGQPEGDWGLFTIWMDADLEHSLSRTRCISNIETKLDDAKSKAEFASDGFKDLLARVQALEEQRHQCDPHIYNRLSVLETSLDVLRQTSAAREDVVNIQKELTEWKKKGDEKDDCIKKIEEKSANMDKRLGTVDTLLRNMCRGLGENQNVLSSTAQTGPEWGSAVNSREATPVPSQERETHRVQPQTNRTNRPTLTTVTSSTTREVGVAVENRQDLPDLRNAGSGGNAINNLLPTSRRDTSATRTRTGQHQGASEDQLRGMPNDQSIDLNRLQPLPTSWRGSRGSPLYTEDQVESAQYTARQTLQSLRIQVESGAPRVAVSLNDQCNHIITVMENNIVESLDTSDKVKDVYNTTMSWMQGEVKELKRLQTAYETSVAVEGQDETLLDTVQQVIKAANEWMREVQRKYRELGCGQRPLSSRHAQDIPVFDGRAGISIYEFLDRFKTGLQGEGSSKEQANLLHRKYLSIDIKQMTVDKKDNFEDLEAELMDRYGHPQVVVSNIVEEIPAHNLPTAADNQRGALAAHLRKLESGYAHIANLQKYGINQENLLTHLKSHEFLESMKKRIPAHMIVELNKEFRHKNLSKTLLSGWDHYMVMRKFITDMATDYDSFQETGGASQKSIKQKPRDTGVKRKEISPVGKVNQLQGDEDSDEEQTHKSVNFIDSNHQSRQGPGGAKRPYRQTRPDGSLKCPMDGDEHRAHGLPECGEFWAMNTGTRRSLLRERACYACLGPRDNCRQGCANDPPKEMLCQGCLDAKARFVPAAALCRVEQHRNQANGEEVLEAMQEFLVKFDGKFYKSETFLDQTIANQ